MDRIELRLLMKSISKMIKNGYTLEKCAEKLKLKFLSETEEIIIEEKFVGKINKTDLMLNKVFNEKYFECVIPLNYIHIGINDEGNLYSYINCDLYQKKYTEKNTYLQLSTKIPLI